MRPVNKGKSPYIKIKHYRDAAPYLEEKIGLYCSYCEFEISHGPQIDHIISKSKDGDLTAWSNLLLGCVYCNSRKNKQTKKGDEDKYLWPDQYNTALAYTYYHGIPKVNKELLLKIDPSGKYYNKAVALFDLVKLDNLPTPKQVDRRYKKRLEAYTIAKNSLNTWQKMKKMPNDKSDLYKDSIKTIQR